MEDFNANSPLIFEDIRFKKALECFNSADWYHAHDAFEELWHETNGPLRTTLQAILQIAVAQLHLERGNIVGATILFGEGLGRLRRNGITDFGLDIDKLCECVQDRLTLLQKGIDPVNLPIPFLYQINSGNS